jgi:hypothetical protein
LSFVLTKIKERMPNMKAKLNFSCFALVAAVGLAAGSLQAQVSATGTISGALVGGLYDYTLIVNNTGSVPIEGFWYGWTGSSNNLPSDPSSFASASGWSASLFFGTSIQFQGNAGDAIPVGGSGTFTFDSTSDPTAMTTPPVGESVVYAGTIGFSVGEPSSEQFDPTLSAVPEPSTFGLVIAGSLGLLARWKGTAFGAKKAAAAAGG